MPWYVMVRVRQETRRVLGCDGHEPPIGWLSSQGKLRMSLLLLTIWQMARISTGTHQDTTSCLGLLDFCKDASQFLLWKLILQTANQVNLLRNRWTLPARMSIGTNCFVLLLTMRSFALRDKDWCAWSLGVLRKKKDWTFWCVQWQGSWYLPEHKPSRVKLGGQGVFLSFISQFIMFLKDQIQPTLCQDQKFHSDSHTPYEVFLNKFLWPMCWSFGIWLTWEGGLRTFKFTAPLEDLVLSWFRRVVGDDCVLLLTIVFDIIWLQE